MSQHATSDSFNHEPREPHAVRTRPRGARHDTQPRGHQAVAAVPRRRTGRSSRLPRPGPEPARRGAPDPARPGRSRRTPRGALAATARRPCRPPPPRLAPQPVPGLPGPPLRLGLRPGPRPAGRKPFAVRHRPHRHPGHGRRRTDPRGSCPRARHPGPQPAGGHLPRGRLRRQRRPGQQPVPGHGHGRLRRGQFRGAPQRRVRAAGRGTVHGCGRVHFGTFPARTPRGDPPHPDHPGRGALAGYRTQ